MGLKKKQSEAEKKAAAEAQYALLDTNERILKDIHDAYAKVVPTKDAAPLLPGSPGYNSTWLREVAVEFTRDGESDERAYADWKTAVTNNE